MITNIAAKGFKLTKAIESKVNDDLGKLDKFNLNNTTAEVSLSAETYGQKAEINFKIDGAHFRAENIDSNLYNAIESAVNVLVKQVRRYQDYKKSNTRESIRFKGKSSKKTIIDDSSSEPKIVKRKMITAKPMFEAEAILQMELLDHNSFMFHNVDTDSPCMIYKRRDGNYGLIETV